MKIKDVIYQLEDLKSHCQDWIDKDEEDSIWGKDVQALEKAIEIIKMQVEKDEIESWELNDSGNRREFSTGAVRDIKEGKGRCDLMPLDVIGQWMNNQVLTDIYNFIITGDDGYLFKALDYEIAPVEVPKYVLELSEHFEQGTVKYGERNWEKGIPLSSYVDSAVRHYLKYLDEQEDENHFIAFVWNIICAIWTNRWSPEMRDLPYERKDI